MHPTATKIISFLNCFPLKYPIYDSPHSILQKFSLVLKTLQQNLYFSIFTQIKTKFGDYLNHIWGEIKLSRCFSLELTLNNKLKNITL